MSIWSRIAEVIASLAAGEGLAALFERKTPPERSVAFTIAVIGLGAQIAKADGRVTRDEVSAFREVFTIAREDERAAARVYNLARQDVAGYEDYAGKIRRMFGTGGEAPLEDVIEGLFHIAMADGTYHPGEDAYLARVAEIFGYSAVRFAQMRAKYAPGEIPDPWTVLGASADMPLDEVRRLWHSEVRASHPDALTARGLPPEAIRLGEARLVAVNRAWAEISGRAAV